MQRTVEGLRWASKRNLFQQETLLHSNKIRNKKSLSFSTPNIFLKSKLISAQSIQTKYLHLSCIPLQSNYLIRTIFTQRKIMSPEKSKKDVVIPKGYKLITEGTVSMIYPDSENSVFYNPVQVQNRDLSILMIMLYAERQAKRCYIKEIKKEKKIKVEEAEEIASKINWSEYVHTHSKEKGLRILDALAASGLRSIRYQKEIPGVKEVIINDLDEDAVKLAKENINFNNVPDDGSLSVKLGDATALMYNSRDPKEQFDVIDLDPYGSAAPFLDGAMQSVKNGGLLCITCTDMAALGGSHPETCFGRYGSMPIQRAPYLQEFAVRVLLQSLSRTANVYGRTIKPILSVGMAFYVRVFVEVYDDKAGVSRSSTNIGYVYQSTQCDSFWTIKQGLYNGKNYQPGRTATRNTLETNNGSSKKRKKGKTNQSPTENKEIEGICNPLPTPFQCPETKSSFKIGGPIWLAPLHDFPVVNKAINFLENYKDPDVHKNTTTPYPIFQTKKPLHGLLTCVSEEIPDAPLYYTLPSLSHTMHCASPPILMFYSAIRNAGYQASAYHKEPNAIKTTAPPDVVWDIMRGWCKEHPVSKKWTEGDNENSTTAKILNRGMVVLTGKSNDGKTKTLDFTIKKENKKRAQRYPMNPEANWGPKPRAGSKRSIKSNGDSTGEIDKKRSKKENNLQPAEK